MRIFSRIFSVLFVGAFAFAPLSVHAQSTNGGAGTATQTIASIVDSLSRDECSLTGSVGAACGTITSNDIYKAARVDPGTSVYPVDIWNICRYVDNISTKSLSHPVFWNSANEWQHTVNSAEHDFLFTRCSLPWTPPAPSADTNSTSPTYCLSSSLIVGSGPTAFSYERVGAAAHSAAAQYSCSCQDGSHWTQTATQLYLPKFLTDNDNASRIGLSANTAGWQLSGAVSYSGTKPANCDSTPPTCGLANGVAASSAPAANLCNVGTASQVAGTGPWTWTCANGGTTASCSAPALPAGLCTFERHFLKQTLSSGDIDNVEQRVSLSAGQTYFDPDFGGYHWLGNVIQTSLAIVTHEWQCPLGSGQPCDWQSGYTNSSGQTGILLKCTPPQCGAAAGVSSGVAPASNTLCGVGSSSAVTSNGSNWNWTCSVGEASTSCAAPVTPASTCTLGAETNLPGTGLYIVTGGNESDCLRAYQQYMPNFVAYVCPSSGTLTSSTSLCYTRFTIQDTRPLGNGGPLAFWCQVYVKSCQALSGGGGGCINCNNIHVNSM